MREHVQLTTMLSRVIPGNSLYKDALSNLNQVANNSNSGSSGNGFPAAAPDRNRNRPAGQLTGFSGAGSSGYSSASNDSGSGYGGGGGSSAGQLTPFAGVANGKTTDDDEFANNTPGGIGPQQGYLSSSSSGRSFMGGLGGFGGGLGSLGGITSLLGAGSMGSMLGGGVRYNGYNSGYNGRYGGTSTRIKRVAIGGLGVSRSRCFVWTAGATAEMSKVLR